MTELTLFKSSNVPAHLRGAEMSETTKALMGGGGTGKRISIKGGTFRLVVGGKEVTRIDDRHLDVIVVKAAAKVGRQFYKEGYDPDAQAAAPDCWSQDGERPDPSSRNKQCDTCNGCPQNIAGSGRGESRACRYQQRLALMLADDMESGVYQLALPATSLFGKEDGNNRPLQAYVRYLAAQTPPVNIEALVTRMKFDTSVESPKLFFSPVRWITADEHELAVEAANSPEAKAAVTMTVAQTDGVSKPAPLAIPGERPKAVEPEPEPEAEIKPIKTRAKAKAEPEADPDEPEKRKPATKASDSVPKGKDLASVVAQWDDGE
jgi:hypothetical protein